MLLRRSLARRIGSAVVALVCVVGTVACGTSAPPAPAQVVGPPLAGEPIRVMTWAPASGPSPINHPDVAVVALAYANMVNNQGGIGGRPLEVLVCDEHGERGAAQTCAERAVAEGVVAVVGSVSVNAQAYLPVLDAAGIAYVGGVPLSEPDYTHPISFPIVGGAPVASVGAGLLAVRPGCQRAALVRQDIASTARATNYLQAGLAVEATTLVADVEVPAGKEDLTQTVGLATAESDCIVLYAPEQDVQRFLSAFQQAGGRQRIISFPNSLTTRVAAQFPAIARDAGIVDFFPPVGNAVWTGYRDAIARSADRDGVDLSGTVQRNTWAAYEVFTRLARKQAELGAATILAALRKASAVDTDGLLPTLNLRAPYRRPGLERLFNRSVYYLRFANGALTERQPGFIDTTPALSKATLPLPQNAG